MRITLSADEFSSLAEAVFPASEERRDRPGRPTTSAAWLARVWDMDHSGIRRWMTGKREVPTYAAEALLHLYAARVLIPSQRKALEVAAAHAEEWESVLTPARIPDELQDRIVVILEDAAPVAVSIIMDDGALTPARYLLSEQELAELGELVQRAIDNHGGERRYARR